MVGNVARRRFAAPSRRITAYLRLLGRRRFARSNGLGSLRDEIEPRLRGVVADTLGVEPEQLAGEVALEHDLAVDSLDLLEVLGRVEEIFDVVVPDREAAAIRTVDDLIAVTTALVACRIRAREVSPAAAKATFTLRVGEGAVPRFVRTSGSTPYDEELLREDLRWAPTDQPVALNGVDDATLPALERTLLRASLLGTDVRTNPRGVRADVPGGKCDDAARSWPMDRLADVWVALIGRLAAERDATVARLDEPGREASNPLADSRAASNGDVVRFRAVVETYLGVLADARPAIHAAARELGRLELVRRAVDEHLAPAGEVRDTYDGIRETLADAVDALRARDGRTPRRRPPRAIVPGARRTEREELRA